MSRQLPECVWGTRGRRWDPIVMVPAPLLPALRNRFMNTCPGPSPLWEKLGHEWWRRRGPWPGAPAGLAEVAVRICALPWCGWRTSHTAPGACLVADLSVPPDGRLALVLGWGGMMLGSQWGRHVPALLQKKATLLPLSPYPAPPHGFHHHLAALSNKDRKCKDWEEFRSDSLFIALVNSGIWSRERWCVCVREREREHAQSCPTLCNPLDHSPLGCSVHGIFQARILEWVAISFSRGSSWPTDGTCVSWPLLHWHVDSLPICLA